MSVSTASLRVHVRLGLLSALLAATLSPHAMETASGVAVPSCSAGDASCAEWADTLSAMEAAGVSAGGGGGGGHDENGNVTRPRRQDGSADPAPPPRTTAPQKVTTQNLPVLQSVKPLRTDATAIRPLPSRTLALSRCIAYHERTLKQGAAQAQLTCSQILAKYRLGA